MGHGHGHGTGVAHRGRLAVVLALSLTVLVVEVVIGLVTGSLALLADALHMVTDTAGLAMALVAIAVAQRPASDRRTYGYHRTEVLAAGVNGLVLFVLSIVILLAAVRRLDEPPEVDGGLVLAAGFLGLVVNLGGLVLLRSGARENLNVRGAYLEVLGDALGSVAVIVAAVIVLTTGWTRADPVASIAIAAFLLPRAVSLLREVVSVLLESTPAGVDLPTLRSHLRALPGVVDVHDLHVWTLTSGMPVMSAHVVVTDAAMADAPRVLAALRACLVDHFDVDHSTFQLESTTHRDSEPHLHH